MKVYKCNICGNVILLLDGDSKRIKCCNQEMELQNTNTEETMNEKHLPIYEITGNKIKVTIGSVIHPMSKEHYIMWLAVVKGDKMTKIDLNPDSKPTYIFDYEEGMTIYSYCNLHGLWKVDVK